MGWREVSEVDFCHVVIDKSNVYVHQGLKAVCPPLT